MLSSKTSTVQRDAVPPWRSDGPSRGGEEGVDSPGFFRHVLEQLPAAAAVCNAGGTIVAVNRIWGAAENLPFGQPLPVGSCIHEEDAALAALVTQVLGGGPQQVESVVTGESASTLVKVSRYDADGFVGAQILCIGLPDGVAAETNSLAQAVIANASDLLFVVDRKLRVRFQNRPMDDRSIEDTLGVPMLQVLDPATHAVAEEKIREVLSTGKRAQFKDVHRQGGRLKAYEARVAPVIRDNNIVGAVINVSDVTPWHEAQARLRSGKRRYEELFNSMPVMLHGSNAAGEITTVNDYWLDKLGYAREEVLGKPGKDFFTPQSQLVLRSGTDRGVFASADESNDVALQMTRKDGSVVDVLAAVSMKKDPRGEIVGLQARMIDITARNRAEAALRKSEARFQRAVRGTSDGLWDWDLESGMVWYAPRFKELLGYQQDEFADNFVSFRESLHPDDRGGTLAAVSQHLDGEHPFDIECRLRTKAGPYKWFRIRGLAYKGDDGSTRRMAGSIQDVTLQRYSDRALRDNRNFYELILDSVPAYIAYVDAKLRVQFINRACTGLFGMTKKAALGQRLDELVGSEHYQQLQEHVETVMTRKAARADLAWGSEREKTLALDVELIPHSNTDDRVLGFFWVARDMTRHQQLENELRQAQKMEAVGQLTGGIAHDFNNLLSVILGNLQLLERRVKESPGLITKVKTAKRAATRGAELTRRLLAFARQQVLAPEVLDLNQLVVGMEDLLQRSLGDAVIIKLFPSEQIWPIEVDPGQVENSLLNLAINARDAMPDGGELIISTENVVLDSDSAAQRPEMSPGDYVMLSVRDSGTGIAPEILEQVVEPFFTTKEVGKGTGLGLSMVFGFAEQSGGHGAIESELGEGTCVKLFFPRCAAAVPQDLAGEEPADADLPGGSETVLVVEDDDDVRETAVSMLSELGYHIIEADSAAAALEILERGEQVDLMFTDVMMPGGMRGTQLALKAREIVPGLKILYATGFTATGILRREVLTSGSDLLGKPYTAEGLAATVRHVLDMEEPAHDSA